MFYSGPERQSWVLTCWLSSTRTWFIEPSHRRGSPLTSFSLRCSQMQETSSGLAETSSGMVAMSSSTTWTCAGCSGLNSGGSNTGTAHEYSHGESDMANWQPATTTKENTKHFERDSINESQTSRRYPTNNFGWSYQLHMLRQRGREETREGEGQALKRRVTVLLSNCSSAQTHSDIPSCSYTVPSFEAVAGCCLWNGIKDKHGHAAKQMHN